ncbi:MAG: hypothetical protein IIX14_00795 [Clostridia bacterium]|nr:hypothetical protein [Clostridia bacterium]
MEETTNTLSNITSIAKAYMRISSIKTALTVFLVGYTAFKVIQTFKSN